MHNLTNQLQSKNYLKELEGYMGIEISDEELLAMEPKLLLQLQEHLKDFRHKNQSIVSAPSQTNEFIYVSTEENEELQIRKTWELATADAIFEEVETLGGKFLGTRVTQDGRTYIARKWELTAEIKEVLSKANDLGFAKFWRYGQPQDSYFLGGANYLKGSPHISCSRGHSDPWVFALDQICRGREGGRQKIKEITFNKLYKIYWETALTGGEPSPPTDGILLPGTYKIQNYGGHCFTMHPDDFENVIEYFAVNFPEED